MDGGSAACNLYSSHGSRETAVFQWSNLDWVCDVDLNNLTSRKRSGRRDNKLTQAVPIISFSYCIQL